MTHPDAQRAFEEMMPEPTCSVDPSGFLEMMVAGHIPAHAPLFTADQLRTAMQAVWDAATERAAKAWLPIETAPKDGSKFLAFRRGEVATASVFVRDDGEIWSFGRESAHVDVFPDIVPSHYMPLPEAPAAAIRGTK